MTGRAGGRAGGQAVDRRGFLGSASGLFLGLPFLGLAERLTARPPDRPRFPLGIQLYTLRELLQRDLDGTLAQLAQLGCQEVELAGTYGRSAADFRKVLDRHHLKAPAGHGDIAAITDNLTTTIADAKTLGHRYVVVAWIPEESRTVEGYTQVAETFNQAGAALKKAGLRLGYHNHAFEFADLGNGHTGYDILLNRTDPRFLTMELDLFWIRRGGKDALDYFSRHSGRFSMVHVKDMAADGAMVDVGAGVMNWGELLTAARKAGVRHAFVEHDEAKDPVAFARTSFEYMKRLSGGA